ncbi:hypothetical protein [Pseudomonas putida]|uniref:hypothetical protein n=1 Tax=Pseudomonas putida TaxID=303 RepID=UPI000AD53DBD|nr:hypothetical protein [Pseudomonas putida]
MKSLYSSLKSAVKNSIQSIKVSSASKIEGFKNETAELAKNKNKDNNMAKSALSIGSMLIAIAVYATCKLFDVNGALAIVAGVTSQIIILSGIYYYYYKRNNSKNIENKKP